MFMQFWHDKMWRMADFFFLNTCTLALLKYTITIQRTETPPADMTRSDFSWAEDFSFFLQLTNFIGDLSSNSG